MLNRIIGLWHAVIFALHLHWSVVSASLHSPNAFDVLNPRFPRFPSNLIISYHFQVPCDISTTNQKTCSISINGSRLGPPSGRGSQEGHCQR